MHFIKPILISFLILFIQVTKSQAQEFLGIKAEGKNTVVIEQFKSKGFIQKSQYENTVTLSGKAGGKDVNLIIVWTPISKTVWKFSVYLEKRESWSMLKADYNEYLQILTEKYGPPGDSFNFFKSPYKDGDGLEKIAVKIEQCVYSAFWDNMSIEISKFMQVNIAYENPVNSKLNDEEKKSLSKNDF